ncbi:MAG: aspartate aminotransferase family protein [Xanthomonadales bacterium]|nr:aspartate aminotransferase family protein [Xanthomonadales bacterium]
MNHPKQPAPDHLLGVYGRMPVRFQRGEGVWLWDDQGNRYLDAITGIGVCSLGHAHPEIADAIADQARTLIHTSNIPRIPLQEQLAEQLCEIAGMDHAFFGNSGAEAIECCVKMARAYGHRVRGISSPEILVMSGCFHGRTMTCISASDNPKYQQGFEPLLPGFVSAPFGDLDAVRALASSHPSLVAVMLEPVQGEGGVVVAPDGYLADLRGLCDELGLLLIADEVQTGMGKTGSWFAYQHEQVVPDIVAVAKALGNGVPIGACLARAEVSQVMVPGDHGSTYGGNPLACRAGLAVINIMRRDDIPQRAADMGQRLRLRLGQRLADTPGVREIRGRGLMIGIELDRDATPVKTAALGRHVLTNVTRGKVVRLLPPLIIEQEELELLAEVIGDSILQLLEGGE